MTHDAAMQPLSSPALAPDFTNCDAEVAEVEVFQALRLLLPTLRRKPHLDVSAKREVCVAKLSRATRHFARTRPRAVISGLLMSCAKRKSGAAPSLPSAWLGQCDQVARQSAGTGLQPLVIIALLFKPFLGIFLGLGGMHLQQQPGLGLGE